MNAKAMMRWLLVGWSGSSQKWSRNNQKHTHAWASNHSRTGREHPYGSSLLPWLGALVGLSNRERPLKRRYFFGPCVFVWMGHWQAVWGWSKWSIWPGPRWHRSIISPHIVMAFKRIHSIFVSYISSEIYNFLTSSLQSWVGITQVELVWVGFCLVNPTFYIPRHGWARLGYLIRFQKLSRDNLG